MLVFCTNLYANNDVVLECFSLNGNYEFKYYGIKNDELYYFNHRKVIKKVPYENMKVNKNKMFVLTQKNALTFELVGNALTLKKSTKNGQITKYACSRLNNRNLKDFKNK